MLYYIILYYIILHYIVLCCPRPQLSIRLQAEMSSCLAVVGERGSAPKGGRVSILSETLLVKCASVQWQPDGLTIHNNKWFLGAGFLGAPPISLRSGASRASGPPRHPPASADTARRSPPPILQIALNDTLTVKLCLGKHIYLFKTFYYFNLC